MSETIKEKQHATSLIILGTFLLGLLEIAMLYHLVSTSPPRQNLQDITYTLGWMVVTFCFIWNIFTIFERRQNTEKAKDTSQ